jgi:peroxiredoxin/ketosteroid isomerase-like protein
MVLEGNEKRVRAFYEATAPGHRQATRGLQSPHVVYDLPAGMPVGSGHFEGLDAVTERFLDRFYGALDVHFVVEEFIAAGDEVAAVGRIEGRARKSGAPIDVPFVHIWTVRDGYLQRLRAFTDTATLSAALGSVRGEAASTRSREASDGLLPAGVAAPDFTLKSSPSETLSLRALRGSPVILAFYPADWSPVCGDQMVLYNQVLPTFNTYGARVLGISVDGAWCHQAFAEARNLRFPLLADFEPKGEVALRYGAYDPQTGETQRALFVIDKHGVIAWSYLSPIDVSPGADGILDALEKLPQE